MTLRHRGSRIGLLCGLATVLGAPAAYALRWRNRLYAPVADRAGRRAALAGGLFAAVAGSLANDSGPVLLVFGVVVLALTTAYIRGAGEARR